MKTEDIADIAGGLAAYDSRLVLKTGCTLRELACRAAGVEEAMIRGVSGDVRVGVTPISWGQGIIRGFSEALKSIAAHLGFDAFVTRAPDVAGMAEAFERKADVLLMSDDERYVAMGVRSRRVVDNGDATGKGFVVGLDLLAGGLRDHRVLVIGCGPVGLGAARRLIRLGAVVSVYDINRDRSRELAREIKTSLDAEVRIEKELESALLRRRRIIDASPAGSLIHARHITADTFISAPGMPLALTAAARKKIAGRLLHDPLRIGTAVMIVEAGGRGGMVNGQ
ncbi:MAG: 3-methylornithyl-N6-L-lysine dehydrogenase PylD [Desulfobacterales bacterium]|nr:3-methylornithyl-N6-L-lysine dehydrogenase PylD [Desulfobacterales bacterium]